MLNDVAGVSAVLRAIGVATWRWEFDSLGFLGVNNFRFEESDAPIWSRVHPRDRERVLNSALQAFRERSVFEVEYRVVDEKGGVRWIHDRGVCIVNAGVPIALHGISMDVTERWRREENERQQRKRLELSSQRRSEFLARIGRELCVSVDSLTAAASGLLRSPSARERRDLLRQVIEEGDHVAASFGRVLDLSCLESERLSIEIGSFSLSSILETVAGDFAESARAKGVLFKVLTEGSLPEVIESDFSRIKQVLFNLIDNAVRFTDRGRVELRVKDVSDPLSRRRRLRFTVRDTGVGIRAEQVPNLFEPFAGGQGLSLPLSKRLARALGGELVLIESQRERGSTFALTIDAGEKNPVPRSGEQVSRGSLRDLRLLVVEEVEENRHLVCRFLESTGVRIEFAEADESVDRILSESFDVVLLSTHLRRVDGFETVRSLRRRDYSKPVIALIGEEKPSERARCLEAGFDDRVWQPLEGVALVETLRRVALRSYR